MTRLVRGAVVGAIAGAAGELFSAWVAKRSVSSGALESAIAAGAAAGFTFAALRGA
jgi:hypothetical protein